MRGDDFAKAVTFPEDSFPEDAIPVIYPKDVARVGVGVMCVCQGKGPSFVHIRRPDFLTNGSAKSCTYRVPG